MKTMRKYAPWLLVFTLVLTLFPSTQAMAEVSSLTAKIVEVQKYGNVVLDLKAKDMADAGYEAGDTVNIEVGESKLEMPYCTSYSDVDTGSLLLRNDTKNDLLLAAINMGNFSETYKAKEGDSITISLKEKKGYLSEYLLRQLERTNNRGDYATDSIFANFRGITTAGIKKGVLYRSASPINNEIGRAAYADKLTEAVGVRTVVNLADNKTEIASYAAKEDFDSPYYKSLIDKKQVKLLDMSVDIASKEFGKKLASGMKFMAKHKAPYLIHCTEGKDRAGFTAAVLEGLMGASMDEIVKDYMVTYENYYHVERDSEQYKKIADANIITSMTTVVFGMEKGSDISKVNVAEAVNKYLRKIGVSKKDIAKLKANLAGKGVFKKPNISGKVVEIEKYGHASTNIKIEDFNKKGFNIADRVTVLFNNGFVAEAPYLDGYLVDAGELLVRAYPGHENVAICINYGKLNETAKVDTGSKFTIMLNKKAGYKDEYDVRKLERTYDRADYESDEVYANFRNVKMGTMAAGVLFRSSSPVNNELKRAKFADKLIENTKVKTIVNLADKKENIDKYVGMEDFASPYYDKLYKDGKVILLNLGLAYNSKEFKEGIVKGAAFMADNEAPYLFHCTEGKDRTGYMSAFLGALMGASKEEIIDDYMKSYVNFYHVEKDGKQYQVITKDVVKMLESIAGSTDLTKENLTKGAEKILKDNGMTADKTEALKKKLSTSAN